MTRKNKIQYPQDNKQRDKNNEYNKMNNLMIVFNYMKSILKMIIFIRNMVMRFNKILSMRIIIIPMIQSIIYNIKKILKQKMYVNIYIQFNDFYLFLQF